MIIIFESPYNFFSFLFGNPKIPKKKTIKPNKTRVLLKKQWVGFFIKNPGFFQPWYKCTNRQNVYNKSSSRTLTDNETILIGLGHGFNTEADRNNIIETVDAFEFFFVQN